MDNILTSPPSDPENYKFVVRADATGWVSLSAADIAQRAADNEAVTREAQRQLIIDIKTEAQRRILERYPQWKQSNMMARAMDMVRIGSANWSEAEQSEAAALDVAWAWIKQVRDVSNALEAEKQADYLNNLYWPS